MSSLLVQRKGKSGGVLVMSKADRIMAGQRIGHENTEGYYFYYSRITV